MLLSDTQTALFQNINSNNNWQVAPSISTLTLDVHCMENVSHICNIFLKLISRSHSPTSSRGNGMRSRHFLEYLQLKSSIQSKLNFAVIVPDLASASWELINICSSKKTKKNLKNKMRTELHHHHHYHQVPTCGIKHKVLHRTHLKTKG